MSLEVFEKLESKVQQAIDTITLLQMEIEEQQPGAGSTERAAQPRRTGARKQPTARTAERLAGSPAGAAGTYGRSLIPTGMN